MPTALFAAHALLASGWARDVLIEWDGEGTITHVTPGASAGTTDVAAGSVLPGMPNVHSHAFQRAMAGLAEVRGHPTDDFWTWREAMYHLVAHLTPEDVQAIAAQLYVEMLRHGYTSVAEFHYLHHQADGTPYEDRAEIAHRVVAAAKHSGIAMTLLPVLYAYGGFGHKPLKAAQRRFAGSVQSIADLLRELSSHYLPDSRLRLGVAPHSVRAVDALMLTEMVAAMDGIDATAPIHMHVSEQLGEVRECLATHGVTPLTWVADIAAIDRRWCLIHATHVTKDEAGRMRAAGAVAGLCPMTEANLGDGIFAFEAHFRAGGRFAIGGDSHVCVSPFEELRTLEYSQRLQLRVRNVAASQEAPDVATNLWSGACAGGAAALGQDIGAILPGKRADLVVLDGAHVDFEGLDAPAMLACAMFSGGANRVRDVFVAGARAIEDGRHPLEAKTEQDYRSAIKRLRAAG
jgi:formimidoylglutamate deiminase